MQGPEDGAVERYHRTLRDCLDDVSITGTFAHFDANEFAPNPGIHVQDLGLLHLPLGADQARALASRCRQAPFGKGAQTFVDTSVRRTWELDPASFELRNSCLGLLGYLKS